MFSFEFYDSLIGYEVVYHFFKVLLNKLGTWGLPLECRLVDEAEEHLEGIMAHSTRIYQRIGPLIRKK